MPVNVLVLGGTAEATALCAALHARGIKGVVSFAGRVERPARQPLPRRMGGFGGVDGLAAYLKDNAVTHVVDATHPFTAQMSAHAVAACARAGVPLIALSRPPWTEQPGDSWRRVPDMAAAADALAGPACRVMLAVGRMYLPLFEAHPQHFYLLRLVDPPATPPNFPDMHIELSRGPFTLDGDRALMAAQDIDLVVSRNAGGKGARAKIDAARDRGIAVIMIARPALPERVEAASVDAVLEWLGHQDTRRGV